jgi:hypothetical protein
MFTNKVFSYFEKQRESLHKKKGDLTIKKKKHHLLLRQIENGD